MYDFFEYFFLLDFFQLEALKPKDTSFKLLYMLSNFSLLEYFDGGIQLLRSYLERDGGPSKCECMRARGEGGVMSMRTFTHRFS